MSKIKYSDGTRFYDLDDIAFGKVRIHSDEEGGNIRWIDKNGCMHELDSALEVTPNHLGTRVYTFDATDGSETGNLHMLQWSNSENINLDKVNNLILIMSEQPDSNKYYTQGDCLIWIQP